MSTQVDFPDNHHDTYSKTVFGFWIYLLTDFMLFATLFAAYAVLRNNTFGGPTAKELFSLNYSTLQATIFLVSTLAAGIGGAYAHRGHKIGTIVAFVFTMVFAVLFLVMGFHEYSYLIASGSGWQTSAFASMFFSLTGIFFLHVLIGLLWIVLFLIPVCISREFPKESVRRFTCIKMFWQFLNIVWVFIYTVVYLLGVI